MGLNFSCPGATIERSADLPTPQLQQSTPPETHLTCGGTVHPLTDFDASVGPSECEEASGRFMFVVSRRDKGFDSSEGMDYDDDCSSDSESPRLRHRQARQWHSADDVCMHQMRQWHDSDEFGDAPSADWHGWGPARSGRTRVQPPPRQSTPPRAQPETLVGCRNGSSPDQIRAAFAKGLKDAHPDRGGDAAKFRGILDGFRLWKEQNEA
eukprot:TRINITY_DN4748_c0_g2_i1.p1 TRINITY_DN4748_c0_g2~~TRINITY_DN4748_c0_g2_i1.p1  ORF type:complete len:210 (+),score=50.92 TRINITY_DN4748_c0_g2_i1:84-713(+)